MSMSESLKVKMVDNNQGNTSWPRLWFLGILSLRWLIELDSLHPDQWSGYSSILLLLLLKHEAWTLGMTAISIFGLGWFHCLTTEYFSHESIAWRFKILKPVTVLPVLCIMLKQSFLFFPLLYCGIKLYRKLNAGEFQYSLELPPNTILCFLLYYFFSSLHIIY